MERPKKPRSDPAALRGLRVSVHVRGALPSAELKDEIERRVRFALARFGHVIRRARVDVAHQRGEVVCQLQLDDLDEPLISVLARHVDSTVALENAIAYAIQALVRRRRRRPHRRSEGLGPNTSIAPK